MTASDPQLAEIVTRFETFEVQAGRGGYTLRHRGSHAPVARLRPIPDSDRFELFYWSAVRGRWRTFGDFGRLKLTQLPTGTLGSGKMGAPPRRCAIALNQCGDESRRARASEQGRAD